MNASFWFRAADEAARMHAALQVRAASLADGVQLWLEGNEVGAYRPLWTGLGIIAGYGLAVLGLTYYVRDRIGAARWRKLHRVVALFWVLAIVHTIGAGSDSAQIWFLLVSGLFVVPAALLLILRWANRWWNAPVAPRVPNRA